MDRILDLARQLGEAVAAHPRFETLRAARAAFASDEEAQALQRAYDEAGETLREKLSSGQPLEPEEKRREQELRAKIAANPVLMDLLRAQADFHDLMQKANVAIEEQTRLPGDDGGDGGEAPGNEGHGDKAGEADKAGESAESGGKVGGKDGEAAEAEGGRGGAGYRARNAG